MEMARWCLDMQTGVLLRLPRETTWHGMNKMDQSELEAMRVARRALSVYSQSMTKWSPEDFAFNDKMMGIERRLK